MKPHADSVRDLYALKSGRPRRAGALGLVLLTAVALLLAFLVWPYTTLWRLDRAARSGDPAALADFVDLDAVRGEIKRKLNKDADSSIGDLSDPFIRWLGEGIEVMGSDAVDRLVTLPWVHARLLGPGSGDGTPGFLRQVTYAFFDAPDGFVVRIGPATDNPVHLHLTLRSLRWRISAAYY